MKAKLPPESATLAKAKSTVERLLKFRPRSEFEIRSKLKEKGFGGEVIDQTVFYFQKLDVLNDTVFAKGWIRSRLNKPMGARRIKEELRLKGIDKEIIAAQLTEAKTNYDETEAVQKAAEKRLRSYRNLKTEQKKQRLFGYLARRGFSNESIYKVLKGLIKNYER